VDEPIGNLSGLALSFLLFQCIDEFDGGEEANALAVMFDGLDTERGRKVGLPGSAMPGRCVFRKLSAPKWPTETFGDSGPVLWLDYSLCLEAHPLTCRKHAAIRR